MVKIILTPRGKNKLLREPKEVNANVRRTWLTLLASINIRPGSAEDIILCTSNYKPNNPTQGMRINLHEKIGTSLKNCYQKKLRQYTIVLYNLVNPVAVDEIPGPSRLMYQRSGVTSTRDSFPNEVDTENVYPNGGGTTTREEQDETLFEEAGIRLNDEDWHTWRANFMAIEGATLAKVNAALWKVKRNRRGLPYKKFRQYVPESVVAFLSDVFHPQ